MITIKDIKDLNNLRSYLKTNNPFSYEDNIEGSEILKTSVTDNTNMYIMTAEDANLFTFTTETIEELTIKKDSIIKDLNIFISKHPEYEFGYALSLGDNYNRITFSSRNKEYGITKTSNTIN